MYANKEQSDVAEKELSKVISYLYSLRDDYCFRSNVELYDYLPAIGHAVNKLNSLHAYFDKAYNESKKK